MVDIKKTLKEITKEKKMPPYVVGKMRITSDKETQEVEVPIFAVQKKRKI